jgi:hypothetical protein
MRWPSLEDTRLQVNWCNMYQHDSLHKLTDVEQGSWPCWVLVSHLWSGVVEVPSRPCRQGDKGGRGVEDNLQGHPAVAF